MILKTELGVIHLGAYSSKLSAQLRRLEEMRRLPTKVNPQDVAYIDLTNPANPFVQMTSESLQKDKLAKKTDPRP